MAVRKVEIAVLENHDTFLVFLQTGSTIRVLPKIDRSYISTAAKLWNSPLGILLALSLAAYRRTVHPATRRLQNRDSADEAGSLGSDAELGHNPDEFDTSRTTRPAPGPSQGHTGSSTAANEPQGHSASFVSAGLL